MSRLGTTDAYEIYIFEGGADNSLETNYKWHHFLQ